MQTETIPTIETDSSVVNRQIAAPDWQPHDAELTTLRVYHHDEGYTEVVLGMRLTLPPLTQRGEITNAMKDRARTEVEATAEYAELARLRSCVDETRKKRSDAQNRASECEAERPQIVLRGDDPGKCEKQLSQAQSDVETLTSRLAILGQAKQEAQEKCRRVAGGIVREAIRKFVADANDALNVKLQEFAACEQLHEFLRANDQQRELSAVRDVEVVNGIVGHKVASPIASLPARQFESTMASNVRGQPTPEPTGPPPGAEHYGSRRPMTVISDGMGSNPNARKNGG